VLLVDDEAAVRKVTRRLLERAGFRVLEAGDPAEALAVARAFAGPIDLLLTDVVMPGMNGNQLAVHLWEERPGIRVLFMSGYSQDDAVRWGVTGPGHAFVEKPFSATTLPRAVEAALATPAGH
jgi:CheY-like chemotaxis protein